MNKWLVGLFCVVSTGLFAFSTLNLSGTYDLVGSNDPSGLVDYRGVVTIVRQGENYRLHWIIGKQTQTGIGIVTENVLSVAYRNDASGSWGVVSFLITPEGNLDGNWAGPSSKSYGREYLTWKY